MWVVAGKKTNPSVPIKDELIICWSCNLLCDKDMTFFPSSKVNFEI